MNFEKQGGETNGDKAPFPYFGGKSKAAGLLWERFGAADLGNYVEPFLGSAAVFLKRPREFSGWVTLNDADGHVVNFWRSIKRFPEQTAEAADNPVFECDLHARHLALVNRRGALTARLMADPDYCEPVLAGWWAWGAASYIGSGWCAGTGPWHASQDAEGVVVFTDGGEGGVNNQLPHLGNAGQGVNRKLPGIGWAGSELIARTTRSDFIRDWFCALQNNFRDARIASGDWLRVCSPGSMTRNGPCAVLLDPPYSETDAVYATDSSTVAHAVREWCVANGSNPLLRIALCGHAGDHDDLEALGWQVETWGKGGGYQGADDRERIWFSAACLRPAQGLLF